MTVEQNVLQQSNSQKVRQRAGRENLEGWWGSLLGSGRWRKRPRGLESYSRAWLFGAYGCCGGCAASLLCFPGDLCVDTETNVGSVAPLMMGVGGRAV